MLTGWRHSLLLAVAAAGLTGGLACASPSAGDGAAPGAGDARWPGGASPERHGAATKAVVLGRGRVEATSGDGSVVLVVDDDPSAAGPVCRGRPEPLLWRLPVDGGEREPVRSEGEAVRAGDLVRGGTGGRVAVVRGCEDVAVAVSVGVEEADGRLRDLRGLDLGGALLSPYTFAWSADGEALVAARSSSRPGGDRGAAVVRVDPVTGDRGEVFEVAGPVSQVAQLADGTYVIAGDGRVTWREASGLVIADTPGAGFDVAPDRMTVARFGPGLRVHRPGHDQAVTVVESDDAEPVFGARFSPDGRKIAFVRQRGGGAEVVVAGIEGGETTSVMEPSARHARPRFSPDGRTLIFNRFGGPPQRIADVLAVGLKD